MRAILLCAGRGSRLRSLTLERPKCLVEVRGKAILAHQIEALHASGIDDIVVVGGYLFDTIAAFLDDYPAPRRPLLLRNPFWGMSSSIGSVWMARDLLAAPFCVVNGDTIFDRALIADALGRLAPGVNLVVEQATGEADEMRVLVEQGRIRAVGKTLPFPRAALRSLGIVACPDADGGPYRAALEQVIGADDGHLSFHHSIVDLLAGTTTVTPIVMEARDWQEIDRPEDIARWEGRDLGDAA